MRRGNVVEQTALVEFLEKRGEAETKQGECVAGFAGGAEAIGCA
jgi:hypothetical protein